MSKYLRHLPLLLALLACSSSGFGQERPPDRKDVRPDARTAERDARRPGERDVRPGERNRRPNEDTRPGAEKARPGEEARPLERGKDVRPAEERAKGEERSPNNIRENKAKGDAWEDETERYLQEEQGKTTERRVTIESKDGKRSVADVMYEKSDGSYAVVEAKSSETASLTRNQDYVFNSISEGDRVTVRGPKLGERVQDKQITVSEIWVSRPGPNGEVRLERFESAEVRAAGQ
jgi:hypothetical protein